MSDLVVVLAFLGGALVVWHVMSQQKPKPARSTEPHLLGHCAHCQTPLLTTDYARMEKLQKQIRLYCKACETGRTRSD